jgi:hypothetical protein
MDVVMEATPDYQLKDSYTGKAVHAPGDKHFDPPAGGMLVFDHSKPELHAACFPPSIYILSFVKIFGATASAGAPTENRWSSR